MSDQTSSNKPKRPQLSIHEAVTHNEIKIVSNLLKTDPTLAYKSDNLSRTPLHYASERGRLDIIKLLFDNGADVNQTDNKGMTAVHFACIHNQHSVLSLFQELCATAMDFDIADEAGNTALHYAAQFGSLQCAQFIIDNGGSANIENAKQSLPLLFAVIHHQLNMAQLLIKNSIEMEDSKIINHTDFNGNTALHYACQLSYVEIAQMLIKYGSADTEIINSDEKKAKDLVVDKTMCNSIFA